MSLLSIVYVSVFFIFEYRATLQSIESEKQQVREQVVKLFESETERLNSFYSTRIKCHLASPTALKAMQERDHEAIYNTAKPKFDILNSKNPYVTHMHFYAPDGTSLMRVHNKEVYGDNIAAKRPMVKHAVTSQSSVSGFEEGYFGLIYRVIEPAFNKQGDYIGSLEFGFQPRYFEQLIKELYPDMKVALVIPKSTLKIYQDSGRFESYKDFYLMGSDREVLKPFIGDAASVNKNQLELEGRNYLLIDDIRLNDFEGHPFIQMLFLKDIQELHDEFYQALLTSFLMGLLLFTLVWLASRYVLNYFSDSATRMHNQLEESHSKLEAIFNNSSEGIALLNYDGGIFDANPAFCRLMVLSDNELALTGLFDLVVEKDRGQLATFLEKVRQGVRIEKLEQLYQPLSGSKLLLEVSMTLLQEEEHILMTCRDITQVRKQQKEIENYVDVVDEYVVTSKTDLKGIITYVSKAFSDISGYTKEELIGQKHSIVRHPDMPFSVYSELWQTISSGKSWSGEIKNLNKDGGYYWVHAVISPDYDDEGEVIGYTAIRHDISDKKRVEALSITDELTGLYNRRYYNDVFDTVFNQRKRDKHPFLFVLIDVDHFKRFNDTYGHHEGDLALAAVAGVLKDGFQRHGDYLFRLGGEEFGAILHVETESDVEMFLKRIHQQIALLNIQHEANLPSKVLTVSVGACLVRTYPEELDETAIYKQADKALYEAKEAGRHQSVLTQV